MTDHRLETIVPDFSSYKVEDLFLKLVSILIGNTEDGGQGSNIVNGGQGSDIFKGVRGQT